MAVRCKTFPARGVKRRIRRSVSRKRIGMSTPVSRLPRSSVNWDSSISFLQFVVEGGEFFVRGLQFLLGGLQFLVGALQFFVAR